ncbi:MAG TPA: zinc ribbon domain-containing protein [Methanomassiliicoccales archaeon]|jgi:predicted neutral ceramidase superfamily lipid hydrolase
MKLGGGSDSKGRKLEKRIEKAKRPHSTYQDALLVGVAFCIFAGALFALSAAVSWADIKMSGSTVDHRYFVDLVQLSGNFGLLWILPFGGIALAVSSVAQLSRIIVEGRWKREVAAVTLALALTTSVISIISVFWLQDLIIRPAGNDGTYGPGVFLCVFGAVLAIAGSLTLFADVMRDEEKAELPERWAKSRESKEEKEYVLPPERSKGKGMKCPKCGAQVKSNWDECPICGAELD